MRIYKAVEQIQQKTVLNKVVCDICKREDSDGTWNMPDPRRAYETSMRCEEYTWQGPGETSLRAYTYDICPTCFAEVLIPFLASQGATPRIEELDT